MLIAAGCSNDEVAARLGISPRTAKAHCDVLRQKLGVKRRRQIPIAYRLLTGDDPLSARASLGLGGEIPPLTGRPDRDDSRRRGRPVVGRTVLGSGRGSRTSGYGKHCDSRRPSAPPSYPAAPPACAARRVEDARQDARCPGRIREDDARRAVDSRGGPARGLVHGASLVDGRRGAGPRPRASFDEPRARTATSACASTFARSPARRRRSTFLRRSSAKTSHPGRSDGWLVIDDYQEISAAEDAELSSATLAAAAPSSS